MGGGLMQLVAYGAQDIYLTGNPQITFFKVVYRRHTNFSMEAIRQTWAGTKGPGARMVATISRNGDLVHKTYIALSGGKYKGSVCNPGAASIASVECEIGGQLIDKHYGHWMETWTELTEQGLDSLHTGQGADLGGLDSKWWNASGTEWVPKSKNIGRCTKDLTTTENKIIWGNNFQTMSGMGGVFNGSDIGGYADNADDSVAQHVPYWVPLYFWFSKNPGLALPLIALQYHEVKIVLTLSADTFVSDGVPSPELWWDYIYLDTDERRRFAQVSHEYLIEQLQFQSFGDQDTTKTLNFNHPVKELIWTGEWTSKKGRWEHTSLNIPTAKWGIKLNGHDRFEAREQHYFAHTQVYQHHSGTGNLDYTGDTTKENICVYSFALKPEEHQPSGTCNFSRIDNAQLVYTNSKTTVLGPINVYAVNYNVLRIMSGMGGLAYSN